MPQVKPVKPLVPPPTDPAQKDHDPSSSDSSSGRRSVDDMNSSPSSRNSKVELQAELLRLEAEKEQLEVDRQRLDEEKKRLQEIDLIILQIVDGQLTLDQLVVSKRSMVRKELFFRIAELANSAFSTEEKKKFTSLCDELMETVLKTDSTLHAELSADIQKELNMELNRLKTGQKAKDTETLKVYDNTLQKWIESSKQNTTSATPQAPDGVTTFPGTALFPGNMSMTNSVGRAMIRFPAAVPITLLPLMLRSPEISTEDLEQLKKEVFSKDILGDVIVDYSSFLATFRGKPNVSAIDTFNRANEKIASIPGLSDRLRLFMLPEYRLPQGMETKNEQLEKYSGSKFEPVYTLLSRQAAPRPTGRGEVAFSIGSLLVTLVTCFMFATDVNSLNEGFLAKAMMAAGGSVDGAAVSVEALVAGREVVGRLLPIAFGLLGLQLTHDAAHYIAAKKHDTKLSLPFFLPSLQIGLFGSITNFLSFPKTRKAMFDISIAGPATGFLFSLIMTLYGLTLTAAASPEVLATFPALPTTFLDSSFLLHEMADQFLHFSALATQPAVTAVHPLVTVGMTGLLCNAFNFLPIGRLDGGRVATAIGGRQVADQIAFITLLGQAVSIFSNASPISFFWILLVVFLQRGADIPPENDVTPIAAEDDTEGGSTKWFMRAATLFFCVSLTGAAILPVPQQYDPQTVQAPGPRQAPGPGQKGGDGSSSIFRGLPDGSKVNSLDI
eukprot:CAMPEP_0119051770 /NCGR_PEP_ID=MMETSP1177-20130426/73275_1 /TAXON_ID=2985 /ORGANISM="Ochromonas sp, Strain CCMP1899" /LENGTH=724 /DNA_ID=CAMNT_0007031091 /DNA_START=367 /DNA_END=2541 /DNA_ORIENTATION=-